MDFNNRQNNNIFEIKNELDNDKLYLSRKDNNNVSSRVRNIINRYIRLDKAYRLKHEELKTLHEAYRKLYQTHKKDNNTTSKRECEIKLDDIYEKIKNNDQHMYKQRLLIIGKIKSDPKIPEEDKQFLAKKMMVVFRVPPIEPYKPIQRIQPRNNAANSSNRVNVRELDTSYINKHNELMTMFKAYKKLYSKTLDYKEKLDEFKTLDVRSSITKRQMGQMLGDQKYVMKSLDKMQDDLIKKDILRNDERIPTTPVVSNLNNIGMFNDTMKEQINNVIGRNSNVTRNAKQEIHKILGTNNNNERDGRIRQILLYRK